MTDRTSISGGHLDIRLPLLCAALAGITATLAGQSSYAVTSVSAAEVAAQLQAHEKSLPRPFDRDGDRERVFNDWLTGHRRSLRERIDRGEDDSLVNLWLFGTTFTAQEPSRDRRDGAPEALASAQAARLEDFLDAVAAAEDERMLFARQVFGRRGIDPSGGGRRAARAFMHGALKRARGEFAATDARLAQARREGPAKELETHSTIFQDRGLSSDTSLLVDFALEQALAALASTGVLAKGSVRRVAIVGPGLDFINKADGHDGYPQQSIQPFAVVDSLRKLELAHSNLRVVTLDVSARVTQHLASATSRAGPGKSYVLHLPLPREERWTSELRGYWQGLGTRIGTPAPARGLVEADVRAISVTPEILAAITPIEADVVSQRLSLGADERFDLVIATNVLVYYPPFEQSLAVANIASMLRSGGLLLSNNDVPAMAPMNLSVGHLAVKYSDRQSDHVFVYQRS